MKKHVVIAGTIYPILLYLLYRATYQENISTIFFVEEGMLSLAEYNKNVIVIKKSKKYKFSAFSKLLFFLWILNLKIKRVTIWKKYFKNAEIYAQDHFHFSPILIDKKDYTYISDGFNNFNVYMRTEMYQNSLKWRSKYSFSHSIKKFLYGPTYKGYFCFNKQCKCMLHENPAKVPYVQHDIQQIKVDMQKIWNFIDYDKRQEIYQFFNVTIKELEAVRQYETILLAQCYEVLGLTEDELIAIYKKALENYDESKLIIKTHHSGKIDYRKYFPEAFVLDKFIPMQLLMLTGEINNIKTAVTINSTAISLFDKNTNIVWLGDRVHPKILALCGDNKMEEVVFFPKKS